MHRTLAATLLAVSLSVAGLAWASDAPGGVVRIKGFAFEPATLQVKQGTAVEWVNQDDAPHAVASDEGAFKSPTLDKGNTFTLTFAQKGGFSYHCAIHSQMKASVVVE